MSNTQEKSKCCGEMVSWNNHCLKCGEPVTPQEKEECKVHGDTVIDIGTGIICEKCREPYILTTTGSMKLITPKADSTESWESKLWDLLYEEYGDVGQNGNIRAFIKSEVEKAFKEGMEHVQNTEQVWLDHAEERGYKKAQQEVIEEFATKIAKLPRYGSTLQTIPPNFWCYKADDIDDLFTNLTNNKQ